MTNAQLRRARRTSQPIAVGTVLAIVHYNAGAALLECLRAVFRQSLRPERILLFDNGSTDGASELLEHRFPGLEVVRFSENRGFAAAANLAFRTARGARWVALMNSDATPARRWLERAWKVAERMPECAAVSSQLVCAHDPQRLDGAGDVYHVCGAAWRARHGELLTETESPRPREVFSACAAAALYRRDAVLEVGGFDEAFFCYFEDVDLGYRLRLAGYRVWHAPRAVARHVGSASTHPGSDFTLYHGHRNLVWSYFRNTPVKLLWKTLPQHLLWNLATVLWFLLRGRGRVVLRAKWDALCGLPRVLRMRFACPRSTDDIENLRGAMARGWARPYRNRR